MIQGGQCARLAPESCELIGADARDMRQDLYADVAAELRVASTVNPTHAATADKRHDFVASKADSAAE
jgi:hypothetical protein